MKNFIVSMFLALIMGTIVASFLGINPLAGMAGSVATSAAYSLMPKAQGTTNTVVLKELFESELLNKFRHEHGWLNEITARNEWVGNNVIRLNDIGDDPEVLINNTTYPIGTVARTDTGIAISLNKYDTVNTSISKDELYAIPFEKPGSVQQQHRETLEEVTGEHGLHICAPPSNTATTPVIITTGGDDGSGRKRLLSIDVAQLKKRLDDAKIPKMGRVLILCSEHTNDLLIEDKAFTTQYQNHTEGLIASRYYGFRVYESSYNPVYNASNVKKAFAAAAAGTDRNASVCLYAPRVVKATGTAEAFVLEAAQNPTGRTAVMGFQLYNIVIPKKYDGMGALVSVPVA